MKSERNIVVMPIETTARELAPKLLLAIKLAEAGFVSYFGFKSMIREVALRSGRAIYLDKGYHSGVSDPLFKELRKAGCLIVDLDEENGVDFKDFHMLNVRMPDQLFDLVDHIMVWGRAQYDHLRTHRKSFDPSRVSITGHPRFDLIKGDYLDFYEQEVARIRRQYGKFVLLNTNTKFGNNMNGRPFIIENYLSRVKGLMDRLEYDDLRLAANINLVRRIIQETPYTVVLRPHPEESMETYRNALGDLERVHLVYEGAALHWLLAAEHVIHNHSTTGLEAAMLGKTPISYNPVKVDLGFVPWIPIACSLCVSTEEELLEMLSKDKVAWPPLPNVDELLENFFSYSRCASRLVVEAMERLAEANPVISPEKRLKLYLTKLRAKALVQRIKGGAAMSALSRNKLNDLKPPVVRQRFGELLAEGAATGPVRLEVVHPLLYRVMPG